MRREIGIEPVVRGREHGREQHPKQQRPECMQHTADCREKALVAQNHKGKQQQGSAAQHNDNEEGRSLLLAHSGGNFGFGYQVSIYNGSSWKTTRATFTRTVNEPYVYSGRTQLGEGGYNTIMSSAIDAAGNENGNTVQDCYMPIPTEGENPQLRSFYGTFDIGWWTDDSQGYLGRSTTG